VNASGARNRFVIGLPSLETFPQLPRLDSCAPPAGDAAGTGSWRYMVTKTCRRPALAFRGVGIRTVRGRRCVSQMSLLLLAAVAASSCATQSVEQTLTLEEHSLRIPLTLEADGTVMLAERPPLVGRIDLSPILKAEGVQPGASMRATVQLMMHYGRLYVVADAFRAIWEITPQPGTTRASYRPIPVVRDAGQDPMKDVRLSRYGSARSSCLRLDRAGGGPVFITSNGEARDDCP